MFSSSQPVTSFSSPKKKGSKKGKRRSSNGDESSRYTKVQRVKGDHAAESLSVDHDHWQFQPAVATLEDLRRSGRTGAGSGGKARQLEKIGTILEDRTVKIRKSTDIPEGAVANPLAPSTKRSKSGRSGKKGLYAPPPPYVPAAPNQVHALAATAPNPVFHQRLSEADRFGFCAPPQPGHPHNHPYIADRDQQTRLDSRSSEFARQPSSAGPVDQPHHMSSQTVDNQSIDHALLDRSFSYRDSLPRADHRHRINADKSTEYSDKSGDSSSESEGDGSEGANEKGNGHEEDGWAATRSKQVTHPGFSQEFQPRVAVRHNSLPSDHEFTFSRDEEEVGAEHNLFISESQNSGATEHRRLQINGPPGLQGPAIVVPQQPRSAFGSEGLAPRASCRNRDGSESQHGGAVDVLNLHHESNGRPSAPDPEGLAVRAFQSAETPEPGRSRAPRNSKKAKDAGPSPQNLGFYPPVWQDSSCLEDAKRECRVSHLLNSNPFPSKSRDLKTSITEALTTTITEWDGGGTVFEPDYWPNHKSGMASVLLGDMSTWRSELKNTAFAVAPIAYKLFPSRDLASLVKAQWVQDSATELVKDSLFLRDGFDELGKTNNFAHPALKEVIIKFFYTGTYRIADKRGQVFRQAIPLPCLALAGAALNCVLDGFVKNGTVTLKTVPQFSGKEYRSTFLTMMKMLNEILGHAYHGPKLRTQIGSWAEEGWSALHQVDIGVERDNHLQLVLD